VLGKMHAPPKQDVPIITAAELPEARQRTMAPWLLASLARVLRACR
jgi:hypothetical protein